MNPQSFQMPPALNSLVNSLSSVFNRLGTTISTITQKLGRLSGGGGGRDAGAEVAAAGTAIGGIISTALQSLTAVIAITVGAFKLLSEGIQVATAHFNALSASGGTPGNISRLTSFGIPADQIAGLGAQVRQALSTNGMAMAEAARRGFSPTLPRPFGSTNEAALLQRLIESLRKDQPGSESQLRAARLFGLEGFLNRINVGESVRQRQDTLFGMGERAAGSGTLKAANDLTESLRVLGETFNLLLLQAIGPFMPALQQLAQTFTDYLAFASEFLARMDAMTGNRKQATAIIQGIANAFQKVFEVFQRLSGNQRVQAAFERLFNVMARLGDKLEGAFEKALEALVTFLEKHGPTLVNVVASIINWIASLIEFFGKLQGRDLKFKGPEMHQSALNANTKAVVDNTRVMREGHFGGGERSRFAAGLSRGNAYHFNQAVEGGALRMGAFALI